MSRRWPLLWFSVGLDLLGVFAAAFIAAHSQHHTIAFVLKPDGFVFALCFLLLAWFFGGYSFLRWPWMPYRQLVQRWLLVVGSAMGLAVLAGWLLNAAPTAVWFHRSTLVILGVGLVLWGLLLRRWLQPLARLQANQRLAASPVVAGRPLGNRSAQPAPPQPQPPERALLLLFVAYHPSLQEVQQLQACLGSCRPRWVMRWW